MRVAGTRLRGVALTTSSWNPIGGHPKWVSVGVFEQILSALAEDLRDQGALDFSECFIDGTFVSA